MEFLEQFFFTVTKDVITVYLLCFMCHFNRVRVKRSENYQQIYPSQMNEMAHKIRFENLNTHVPVEK